MCDTRCVALELEITKVDVGSSGGVGFVDLDAFPEKGEMVEN
jgi:hypothetical protein